MCAWVYLRARVTCRNTAVRRGVSILSPAGSVTRAGHVGHISYTPHFGRDPGNVSTEVNYSATQCHSNRRGPVVNVEFRQNAPHMHMRRVFTDIQRGRYFLVAQSLSDKFQYSVARERSVFVGRHARSAVPAPQRPRGRFPSCTSLITRSRSLDRVSFNK